MSKESKKGCEKEDKGANWRVLGVKLVKRRQWAFVNREGREEMMIRGRRVKTRKIRIKSRVWPSTEHRQVQYTAISTTDHLSPPATRPKKITRFPFKCHLGSLSLSLPS
jgi:hypothetical protein